jgi:hypothetical protein
MVTLKFPKLNSALVKPTKDMLDDDPRRGIIVLEGNAIVLAHEFCLVVNLYDHFTLDCNVSDDEELAEINRILYYMNGKIFNVEFWTELTKGAHMKMKDGYLYIETTRYVKNLHYKEVEFNMFEPLINIKRASEVQENLLSVVALPFGALNSIFETLKADFKNDYIIFEFGMQGQPVKFTFKNRKHFFGYILPNYDASQEGFRFDHLHYFIDDEFVRNLIEDLKGKYAPPPPPKEFRNVEEIVPEQNQLFGGNINE